MSTNTLIRKHLLAQDDILKCRITRNGEVHVYTNAQRGDGGKRPWWKLHSDVETAEREAMEALGYTWVEIPGTMSGVGTIYNLTNEFGRTIRFGPSAQFALVAPAYFGRSWFAEDEDEAIALYEEHRDYYPTIIDREGNEYKVNGGVMEATGRNVTNEGEE